MFSDEIEIEKGPREDEMETGRQNMIVENMSEMFFFGL